MVKPALSRCAPLIIFAVIVSGCVSNQPARDTIQRMDDVERSRNIAQKDIRMQLAEIYFQAVMDRAIANLDAACANTRAEMGNRTMARAQSLAADVTEQLESSLEGAIATMDAEVRAARDAGDRVREMEAALQLSATLAMMERERGKLVEKVHTDLGKILTEETAAVDKYCGEQTRVLSLAIEPGDLAAELLQDLDEKDAETSKAMIAGLEELDRYVNRHAMSRQAFVEGLVPASWANVFDPFTGTSLEEKLTAKGTDLLSNAQNEITANLASLQSDLIQKLVKVGN